MVDDASEEPTSPHNGAPSPRENGLDKLQPKKEHPPHSPRYHKLLDIHLEKMKNRIWHNIMSFLAQG